MKLLSTRHRLLAAGAFFAVTACGAIVGVNSDLTAPADKVEREEAGDPEVDASKDDSGITEFDAAPPPPPPEDAGCTVQQAGPFFPHHFETFDNPNPGFKAVMEFDTTSGLSQDAGATMNMKAFTTSNAADQSSELLAATDFSVQAQPNWIITGVRAELAGRADVDGLFFDKEMRLIVAGAHLTSQNYGILDTAWPTVPNGGFVGHVYGRDTERWGYDDKLNPSLLNDPNFGFAFRMRKTDGNIRDPFMRFDALRVTVFYCLP